MSLVCKMEAEAEVKVKAQKVFEFFKFTPYHLATFPSANIQSLELKEGDWGSKGCIVQWNYTYDGKARADVELTEAIDDEKRTISYRMIEGHLLEFYKSVSAVIQITPKGRDDEDCCTVRFIMDYEKKHAEVMDPHGKLEFSLNVCKEIEARLA